AVSPQPLTSIDSSASQSLTSSTPLTLPASKFPTFFLSVSRNIRSARLNTAELTKTKTRSKGLLLQRRYGHTLLIRKHHHDSIEGATGSPPPPPTPPRRSTHIQRTLHHLHSGIWFQIQHDCIYEMYHEVHSMNAICSR